MDGTFDQSQGGKCAAVCGLLLRHKHDGVGRVILYAILLCGGSANERGVHPISVRIAGDDVEGDARGVIDDYETPCFVGNPHTHTNII